MNINILKEKNIDGIVVKFIFKEIERKIKGKTYKCYVTNIPDKKGKIIDNYIDAIYRSFERFYRTRCPLKSTDHEPCPIMYIRDSCPFKEIFDDGCPLRQDKFMNYPLKSKKDFINQFSSEGLLLLVIDTETDDFVLMMFGNFTRKRVSHKFKDIIYGDDIAEACQLYKDPKYDDVTFFHFADMVKLLTETGYKYIDQGFQPFATGRVLKSEKSMMYFTGVKRVYGFPMYGKWIPVWRKPGSEGCYTSHSMLVGKSKLRAKRTAKSIIPSHYDKEYPWISYLRSLLEDYEGKISDKPMEPITHEIETPNTKTKFIALSACDIETQIEYYKKGYRHGQVGPSKFYDFSKGLYRSLVVMEKTTKYLSFPKEPPSKEDYIDNIPSWPPQLHKKTWEFIQKFNLLEAYPKEAREFFPWVEQV
jgi:hypothetical protein